MLKPLSEISRILCHFSLGTSNAYWQLTSTFKENEKGSNIPKLCHSHSFCGFLQQCMAFLFIEKLNKT